MSRRPTTWLIFFGFLALVSVAVASEAASRVVQYGVWGVWLFLSVILCGHTCTLKLLPVDHASSIRAVSIFCRDLSGAGYSMSKSS
jgi:hypothetical protein